MVYKPVWYHFLHVLYRFSRTLLFHQPGIDNNKKAHPIPLISVQPIHFISAAAAFAAKSSKGVGGRDRHFIVVVVSSTFDSPRKERSLNFPIIKKKLIQIRIASSSSSSSSTTTTTASIPSSVDADEEPAITAAGPVVEGV